MRHRFAHLKLGRVTEHRISLLRNQATALLRSPLAMAVWLVPSAVVPLWVPVEVAVLPLPRAALAPLSSPEAVAVLPLPMPAKATLLSPPATARLC